VRVAAYELLVQPPRDLVRVKRSLLTPELRVNRDLEQKIAELVAEACRIAGIESGERLVRLLEEVGPQRRVRLLELLTYAKGPSIKAGQTINIVHSSGPSLCKQTDGTEDITKAFSSYRLSETMQGDPKANPYLEGGFGWGMVVLMIAVQPAIFEELAFRGTILSALSRAGATPPAKEAFAGPGTPEARHFLVEVLSRREPHLVERARRELARMLAREIGAVPMKGADRNAWIEGLRVAVDAPASK